VNLLRFFFFLSHALAIKERAAFFRTNTPCWHQLSFFFTRRAVRYRVTLFFLFPPSENGLLILFGCLCFSGGRRF